MLALAPRSRTYPVLLPDRPPTEREPARRLNRRRPLPTIVALAVVAGPPPPAPGGPRPQAPPPGDRLLRFLPPGGGAPGQESPVLGTTPAAPAPGAAPRPPTGD